MKETWPPTVSTAYKPKPWPEMLVTLDYQRGSRLKESAPGKTKRKRRRTGPAVNSLELRILHQKPPLLRMANSARLQHATNPNTKRGVQHLPAVRQQQQQLPEEFHGPAVNTYKVIRGCSTNFSENPLVEQPRTTTAHSTSQPNTFHRQGISAKPQPKASKSKSNTRPRVATNCHQMASLPMHSSLSTVS